MRTLEEIRVVIAEHKARAERAEKPERAMVEHRIASALRWAIWPHGETETPKPHADDKIVSVKFTRGRLRDLQQSLADLACWMRGYRAGIGENTANEPIGWEACRDLNILFKRVMDDDEEGR